MGLKKRIVLPETPVILDMAGARILTKLIEGGSLGKLMTIFLENLDTVLKVQDNDTELITAEDLTAVTSGLLKAINAKFEQQSDVLDGLVEIVVANKVEMHHSNVFVSDDKNATGGFSADSGTTLGGDLDDSMLPEEITMDDDELEMDDFDIDIEILPSSDEDTAGDVVEEEGDIYAGFKIT